MTDIMDTLLHSHNHFNNPLYANDALHPDILSGHMNHNWHHNWNHNWNHGWCHHDPFGQHHHNMVGREGNHPLIGNEGHNTIQQPTMHMNAIRAEPAHGTINANGNNHGYNGTVTYDKPTDNGHVTIGGSITGDGHGHNTVASTVTYNSNDGWSVGGGFNNGPGSHNVGGQVGWRW